MMLTDRTVGLEDSHDRFERGAVDPGNALDLFRTDHAVLIESLTRPFPIGDSPIDIFLRYQTGNGTQRTDRSERRRSGQIHHTKNCPRTRIAHEIGALAIPMVIEVIPLHGLRSAIRVEQRNASAPRMPDARIDQPVSPASLARLRQTLRCRIMIWIERRMWRFPSRSQIMEIGMNREDNLPELRRPPGVSAVRAMKRAW